MLRPVLLILALLASTLPAPGNDRLVEQGYRSLEARDFAAAIADFQRALAEEPDNLKAHEGLAWAYYETRAFAEAAAQADRRLALAPADAGWRQNWAIIVREVPERQAEVLATVRSWAEKAPADRAAQHLLGRILADAGQYDEGRRVLDALLADQPDDIEALSTLASIERWDQRYELAHALLLRAVALRPDDESLRRDLAGVTREVRGHRVAYLEPTLPLAFIVILGSILVGQIIDKLTPRTHLMMFLACAVLGGIALAWLYAIPLG